MNIYKIHVEHYSQKDSHASIECFLMADNNESVYEWLDKKMYGYYSDMDEEQEKTEIYDNDYNVIGEETYKEKMLRCKGEMFDEDLELEDLYYGKTVYGWEKIEVKNVQATYDCLYELGIIEKVKSSQGET